MSEQINQLLANIAALTEQVKGGGLYNRDTVTDALKSALDGLRVVRLGEAPSGDVIEVGGRAVPNPIIREGKFAGLHLADVEMIHALMVSAARVDKRNPGPSEALIKALTSTGTGTGDEIVPGAAMSAEMWKDFFTASLVVSQFGRIAMPTDPFDIPLAFGAITWYKGTENTATTATDTATAKSTLTTTELLGEVDWSYSLDEDAVTAVMPAEREEFVRSGAQYMDAFVLNADSTDASTGNINLDDANPDNASYYLSAGQDGIRHQWLVDLATQTVNAGGDALADADILAAMILLGKYATDYRNLRIFTDISTYIKGFLNLDGVQTVDKYGSAAVLVSGELARYRGIPIIVSADHPLAEADGKVSTTAASNTLGSVSIAHVPSWKVGFRRELLMEIDRDIQKRQLIMVGSYRIAVGCRGTRASNTHTAGIRNVLVS